MPKGYPEWPSKYASIGASAGRKTRVVYSLPLTPKECQNFTWMTDARRVAKAADNSGSQLAIWAEHASYASSEVPASETKGLTGQFCGRAKH